MTIFSVPICEKCKHFDTDLKFGLTCRAFPDGIPDDILLGVHDHTEPYPGDKGILFKPKE